MAHAGRSRYLATDAETRDLGQTDQLAGVGETPVQSNTGHIPGAHNPHYLPPNGPGFHSDGQARNEEIDLDGCAQVTFAQPSVAFPFTFPSAAFSHELLSNVSINAQYPPWSSSNLRTGPGLRPPGSPTGQQTWLEPGSFQHSQQYLSPYIEPSVTSGSQQNHVWTDTASDFTVTTATSQISRRPPRPQPHSRGHRLPSRAPAPPSPQRGSKAGRKKCNIAGCNEEFYSKKDLQRHYYSKKHENHNGGGKDYRCACGFTQFRKDNHIRHLRTCPKPANYTYICGPCGAENSDEEAHRGHINSFHLGKPGRPPKDPQIAMTDLKVDSENDTMRQELPYPELDSFSPNYFEGDEFGQHW